MIELAATDDPVVDGRNGSVNSPVNQHRPLADPLQTGDDHSNMDSMEEPRDCDANDLDVSEMKMNFFNETINQSIDTGSLKAIVSEDVADTTLVDDLKTNFFGQQLDETISKEQNSVIAVEKEEPMDIDEEEIGNSTLKSGGENDETIGNEKEEENGEIGEEAVESMDSVEQQKDESVVKGDENGIKAADENEEADLLVVRNEEERSEMSKTKIAEDEKNEEENGENNEEAMKSMENVEQQKDESVVKGEENDFEASEDEDEEADSLVVRNEEKRNEMSTAKQSLSVIADVEEEPIDLEKNEEASIKPEMELSKQVDIQELPEEPKEIEKTNNIIELPEDDVLIANANESVEKPTLETVTKTIKESLSDVSGQQKNKELKDKNDSEGKKDDVIEIKRDQDFDVPDKTDVKDEIDQNDVVVSSQTSKDKKQLESSNSELLTPETPTKNQVEDREVSESVDKKCDQRRSPRAKTKKYSESSLQPARYENSGGVANATAPSEPAATDQMPVEQPAVEILASVKKSKQSAVKPANENARRSARTLKMEQQLPDDHDIDYSSDEPPLKIDEEPKRSTRSRKKKNSGPAITQPSEDVKVNFSQQLGETKPEEKKKKVEMKRKVEAPKEETKETKRVTRGSRKKEQTSSKETEVVEEKEKRKEKVEAEETKNARTSRRTRVKESEQEIFAKTIDSKTKASEEKGDEVAAKRKKIAPKQEKVEKTQANTAKNTRNKTVETTKPVQEAKVEIRKTRSGRVYNR